MKHENIESRIEHTQLPWKVYQSPHLPSEDWIVIQSHIILKPESRYCFKCLKMESPHA